MILLTDEAQTFDRVWWIFFWAAVAVGLFVVVLVTYCVVRFRRRGPELPRQVRHHLPVEVIYTATPFLIVVGLTAVTITSLGDFERADVPDVTVDVTAYQWSWRFEYPDTGVVIDGGPGAGEIPALVLPSSSVVRFQLSSVDVVHSFWVPQFRFKRDVWPGEVQTFDVRMLDTTGTFSNVGACAEFCGLDHATMRFSLEIVTPEAFTAWLDVTAAADGTAP